MARALARLRSWLLNLALLLVSTAFVLGGVELLLRRYLPTDGFLYRLDPRYLYTLAPNARTLFQHAPCNGSGLVLVTVNSQGFRGDELRTDGALRIVVYGDSCIEADYARVAETFTKRLEGRLSVASGRALEAVNAGVNGYGPDQALRRFEDEVAWLRPRVVVFTVFADNDFGDLVRNALYRLEDGRLVEGGGVLVGFARDQFDPALRRRQWPLLAQRLRQILRRSRRNRPSAEVREQRAKEAFATYIQRSLDLCQREYDSLVVNRSHLVQELVRDHYDADVSLSPGSPAASYKRALLEAVLARVRTTATAAGVRVLVLVVPSPIDACDDYEIRVDPRQYPEYDRRRLANEAAAAAGRAGLPVLNLYEPFREAGACRLYYRCSEDHWNALGQDLAARLVAERITSERWLEEARPAP